MMAEHRSSHHERKRKLSSMRKKQTTVKFKEGTECQRSILGTGRKSQQVVWYCEEQMKDCSVSRAFYTTLETELAASVQPHKDCAIPADKMRKALNTQMLFELYFIKLAYILWKILGSTCN